MIRILALLIILFPTQVWAKVYTVAASYSPPFIIESEGQAAGPLIDIAKKVFNNAQMDVKFVLLPWNRALKKAELGEVDAVVDVVKNSRREEFLYFTKRPIAEHEIIGVKKKYRSVYLKKDFSNAKNFSLGTGRGYFYGSKIQKVIDAKQFKRIEEVVGNNLNFKKIAYNRIDMMFSIYDLTKRQTFQQNMTKNIDLMVDPKTKKVIIYGKIDTYLAFSKKNITLEELDNINNSLENLEETVFIKIKK